MPVLTLPMRPRKLRAALVLMAAGAITAATVLGAAVVRADPDSAAYAVCTYLSAGHAPIEATAMVLAANPSLSVDAAALFVGMSMASHCPQFLPTSQHGDQLA